MSHPSLKLLAKILGNHKVRYVIVGGYALLLQGGELTTYDIDLCIAYDPENLDSLAEALNELNPKGRNGAPIRLDRFAFGGAFNTYFTDAGVVQILHRVSGYENFAQLERDSVMFKAGDGTICLASLVALRAMKGNSGRDKDRIHLSIIDDLESLPPRDA